MVIFLRIETFKTFRIIVGQATPQEITDPLWKNLQLKWTFPLDSGNIIFDDNAGLGPNEDEGAWVTDFGRASNRERGISRVVLPKPAMFTIQSEKVIAYSLDFIIAPFSPIADAVINPNVNNNGNDKLKKLNGGESGLSWTTVAGSGVVEDVANNELKPDNIQILTQSFLDVTTQDVFPAPFLLFNKDDIA